MKTTTLRLNDSLVQLFEEMAEARDTSTSAIMRIALSEYVERQASKDPKVGARVQELAEKELRTHAKEVRETFGPNSLQRLDLTSDDR